MNSFREELTEILEYYDGYDMANAKDGKAYTIDQIQAAFLKRKPEKKVERKEYSDEAEDDAYEDWVIEGYNQGTDDWEGNIKK